MSWPKRSTYSYGNHSYAIRCWVRPERAAGAARNGRLRRQMRPERAVLTAVVPRTVRFWRRLRRERAVLAAAARRTAGSGGGFGQNGRFWRRGCPERSVLAAGAARTGGGGAKLIPHSFRIVCFGRFFSPDSFQIVRIALCGFPSTNQPATIRGNGIM